MLRYAKKYVVKPKKEGKEPDPKPTYDERKEEQMSNMRRVMEGATSGSKIDKKIMKRLVPSSIYFKNFPEAKAKKEKIKKEKEERTLQNASEVAMIEAKVG